MGCERSPLGASVTLETLPREADGSQARGLLAVLAETPGQQRGRTVLFPFEASPGPRPHPQLMLFDLHLFFCMDMPSSDKQGFLFFLGVSGQTLLFQIPCEVVRFRCVLAVSLKRRA